MQEIHESSVFQKSYDLYKAIHVTIKKYPKGDRYSLGEKTQIQVLDLIEAITKAGHAKKEWKVPQIEQAIIKLELIKVLIRLGYDTHCLNEKQSLNIQEKIQEIGRMLGGWKRSI
ncbi:four helix bundle protein [Patescibacteria group bacterium]|nr:four helix bundle protein [Patescibacteria group bacterium]